MKKFYVLIYFILTAAIIFAAGEQEKPNYSNIPTQYTAIDLEMDINDELAISSIDAINIYDMENNLLRKVEELFNDFKKKYFLEFHVGAKYGVLKEIHMRENVDADLSPIPIYLSPEVLFKLNLFNPKIYNSKILLNEISLIKEIVLLYKINLSTETWSHINYIEKELVKYEEQIFFKRISIGVGMPFEFNPQESYESNLFFDKINFVIGYDIMDILTINVGYNIVTFDEFYVGASFDVSTPVINSTDVFSSYMKELLRI